MLCVSVVLAVRYSSSAQQVWADVAELLRTSLIPRLEGGRTKIVLF